MVESKLPGSVRLEGAPQVAKKESQLLLGKELQAAKVAELLLLDQS